MGGSSAMPCKRSRYHRIEPLISTRRKDGLWQSIERDEEELASHGENHPVSQVNRAPSMAGNEESVPEKDMTHHVHHYRDTSIATATGTHRTAGALSTSNTKPVKTETPPLENIRRRTPIREDIPANVPDDPSSHPGLATPVRPVTDISHAEPSTPTQPQPATRRRRGRPKKSRNAPKWNRARRVRFSDPIPPDEEPQPESRDTHVFVRLLKIIVSTEENPHSAQRQELAWNNRAKGWRLAGERSEQNIGDVVELFDDVSRHGSLLRVILAPTVQGGAREPVEVGWNAAMCCFQGVSQDMGSLSVVLGEMKDMVKDPWARQFVGYVCTSFAQVSTTRPQDL